VLLQNKDKNAIPFNPKTSASIKTFGNADFDQYENHSLTRTAPGDIRSIPAADMAYIYRDIECRSNTDDGNQCDDNDIPLEMARNEPASADCFHHVPDYSTSPFRVFSAQVSSVTSDRRSNGEIIPSLYSVTKVSQWMGSRDRFSKSISYSFRGLGENESDTDYDLDTMPVPNFDPFATIVDDDEFTFPVLATDDRLSTSVAFDPLRTINDDDDNDDGDEIDFNDPSTVRQRTLSEDYKMQPETEHDRFDESESFNPFHDVQSNGFSVNNSHGKFTGLSDENTDESASVLINPFICNNDPLEDTMTHLDSQYSKLSDELWAGLFKMPSEPISVHCEKQTPILPVEPPILPVSTGKTPILPVSTVSSTDDVDNQTDSHQQLYEPLQLSHHLQHEPISDFTWESDNFVRRTVDSSFDELAAKSRNIVDMLSHTGTARKSPAPSVGESLETFPIQVDNDNDSTSSADSSTSSEYDSSYCDDPLEPFHTDRRPDSWALLLRLPVKKRLIATSGRVWRAVHVRLVCEPVFGRVSEKSGERNLLRVFGDKAETEVVVELPLQPFYRVYDEGLQSVGFNGVKCFCIKKLMIDYIGHRHDIKLFRSFNSVINIMCHGCHEGHSVGPV